MVVRGGRALRTLVRPAPNFAAIEASLNIRLKCECVNILYSFNKQ